MNSDTLQTIVRSVLKVGAGILVTKGVTDDAQAEILVGAVAGIVGVLWGIFHRKPETK